ncbi:MAG: methylated-DNA--[protein]-cysteine S-methyltransferase [Prevotella sp.]|uniref:methylated-DNA--[protein]-cysteine S-methyltransferase n=1 Tax=Prevotella sp. TaxID=59823 RepID=UPI002A34A45D|nr:methylated-DNA--[protein]-cysteine S-methyltransferase [Prevotella sp.]MDD7318289.1 methylated-DNA--[protein]-cysteine S-methyltransferase [Prevotellaceae bacterium]MDY4019707.1 methylated-DNA--[protein]-cysteine S-methyltransferase [Prevotella sp.]
MNEDTKLIKTIYHSPCGSLYLGAVAGGLCFAKWHPIDGGEDGMNDILAAAVRELDEYFAGKRQDFDVPLCYMGGTDFQRRVWNVLKTIPYGSTISYKEESLRYGNEKAIRAVASANGCNPISIFIPCHRVIGSDGSLTGYNGGLDKKRFLLEIERG